jgi:exonuclease VII small subunit
MLDYERAERRTKQLQEQLQHTAQQYSKVMKEERISMTMSSTTNR